ncbi:MAG: hypothetical protein Q7R35_08485 [Elusimicrobiota bacterium]|nr:hypothetical protein [Elusimicrobiota bacterium]
MKLNEPQNYLIKPLGGGEYNLSAESGDCKFYKPATIRGLAKLYTVSDADSLIYVGISQQPMAGRLNYGFKANGESGYHGYKWRDLKRQLRLTVWTAQKDGSPAQLRELETVEAEVAFLCRQRSGLWPVYQHEIHFYQSDECQRNAAGIIYSHAIDWSF